MYFYQKCGIFLVSSCGISCKKKRKLLSQALVFKSIIMLHSQRSACFFFFFLPRLYIIKVLCSSRVCRAIRTMRDLVFPSFVYLVTSRTTLSIMTSVPDIFHKRWGHLFEHCMLTGKENNRGDMYRPRSRSPSCFRSAADQLVGKQTEEL